MSNDTVNEHCKLFKNVQHVGNGTVMTWYSIVRHSWKSPRRPVIQTEVLSLLAAAVFIFLATFGSNHRHRGNKFIQKVLLGAYTLSTSLLTYILGSMQSSSVKNSMYPFWAISLVALYGCTDTITPYILDTNRQGVAFLYQIVLFYAYTLVIFFTVWLSDGFYVATLPALILCVTAVHKCSLRRLACRLASCSSVVDRIIVDYMGSSRVGDFYDSQVMRNCPYLVDWPLCEYTPVQSREEDPTLADGAVRVGDIWGCYKSSELKDACISFSLFHLLRRRFFSFTCHEDNKMVGHMFVFKGLLSETNDQVDSEWVFKVIEVELAFMYDFFFTKYAALHYGLSAATFWSLASAISISLTTYAAATRALTIQCDQAESAVMSAKIDAVITLLLITCAALVELVQPLLYWTTIWGRVSLLCQHARRDRGFRGNYFVMAIKDHLTKIGVYCMSNKHYWQHKLGQYSFLDSVSSDPNPNSSEILEPMAVSKWKKIMPSLRRMLGTPDGLIGQSNVHTREVRRKPTKPIELSLGVKEAIVRCLKWTDGELTNGQSSLSLNGAEHLLWACHLNVHSEYTIASILIWHIATCYVELAEVEHTPQNEGVEWKLHRDVATQLSKYCAYLLVSAPKLLPGHETDSKLMLDVAARDAIKLLYSAESKYEAMKHMASPSDKFTYFDRGVLLGRELECMPECYRWKVLADFWAEMLLYAAPSENAKEHVEQLAKGGEFITHLWALLSNAGIFNRDERNTEGGV